MPIMCRKTVHWLYRNDGDYVWQSGMTVSEDLFFTDVDGTVRLTVERGGRLTVTQGYAWNGCSPKFFVLDLLVGTPDGAVFKPTGKPKTYFASMVHDALYQFLDTGSPIKRADADKCFFRLLEESQFVLRHAYWLAVRVFGWFVWRGKKRVRKWHGRVVTGSLPTVSTDGAA